MTIIYKNNNKSDGTNNVLCISLSEDLNEQIRKWKLIQDKAVFDEQVKTGNFKGHLPINDKQRLKMSKLQEKGIIKPYYGATSADACTYLLQIMPPACIVGVEHELTEKNISFEDAVEIFQVDKLITDNKLNNEFVINDNQYNTLQKWKNWDSKDELTARYIYKFSPGSIGLAITVIDKQTKDEIDISDYSNW